MNFDFGEVLSRAWQIIWKHKILWVFGIFAGCARGGGGGGGSGMGRGGNGSGNQPFPQLQQFFDRMGQWISDHPGVVALLALIALVLFLLAIFLGTIGRIALIRGTVQAEGGTEHLIFGELFSGSMPYFWRVFGLSLLIVLLGLLLGLLIFIPLTLFSVITFGLGLLCTLPLLCVLIPALWGVSLVIEQANVAIVLENLGIGDGVRKGWEVVRANLGSMIVMALILFVGGAVVSFIVGIPIIVAVAPLIFGAVTNNANPAWITAICCAAYFPILLVLSGILNAYIQSVWALTYMRLTAKPLDTPPAVLEANA